MSAEHPIHSEEIRVTLQRPEEESLPERQADAEADGITIINDTSTTACVLVNNGFLGPASLGYVKPGETLVLGASWAWWDVYALFQYTGSHPFVGWLGPIGFKVWYHKKWTMVGYRDTIKLSSNP